MNNNAELKRQAACRAVEEITSGMVLGLGSGSTAEFAFERIAELLSEGRLKNIVGVPSSIRTGRVAARLGIPLTNLNRHPHIDVTIDGADEVDPDLNLIKGGGGALLREKILAQASLRTIIMVDESKLSPHLGLRWGLPVEVLPFARKVEAQYLRSLGAEVRLRCDERHKPIRTDQNNVILDAAYGPISDPYQLGRLLDARAGIMAHGLFTGLTDELIVSGDSDVRLIKSARPSKSNSY
jgi:ribose 5-phosphate isomerase A